MRTVEPCRNNGCGFFVTRADAHCPNCGTRRPFLREETIKDIAEFAMPAVGAVSLAAASCASIYAGVPGAVALGQALTGALGALCAGVPAALFAGLAAYDQAGPSEPRAITFAGVAGIAAGSLAGWAGFSLMSMLGPEPGATATGLLVGAGLGRGIGVLWDRQIRMRVPGSLRATEEAVAKHAARLREIRQRIPKRLEELAGDQNPAAERVREHNRLLAKHVVAKLRECTALQRKIWLIDWHNRLTPLAADREFLTASEIDDRLEVLATLVEEGEERYGDWTEWDGPRSEDDDWDIRWVTRRTEVGRECVQQLGELLDDCQLLRTGLIADQTRLDFRAASRNPAHASAQLGEQALALFATFSARVEIENFTRSLAALDEEAHQLLGRLEVEAWTSPAAIAERVPLDQGEQARDEMTRSILEFFEDHKPSSERLDFQDLFDKYIVRGELPDEQPVFIGGGR